MAPSFLRRCKKCGEEYHPIEQSAECPHEKIEPQPDEGLREVDLVKEIEPILKRYKNSILYPQTTKFLRSTFAAHDIAKIILPKAQARCDKRVREEALLFESRIAGVDEFNDWSEGGLRDFRKKIIPIINKHIEALKGKGEG